MLRHKAMYGEMPCVDRTTDELAVLPRYPPFEPVQFRRGGDMGAVLRTIRSNRRVEVRAAVGAGKSTKLPMMLSKALGCLVVHVIPFHIAADVLCDYLVTLDDGDKVQYVDDVTADLPKRGVIVVAGPYIHARQAYDKFEGVEDMLLVLDESHESDSWTSTMRDLAPAMKTLRAVVKLSATAAPGLTMKPDLPSTREVRNYRTVNVDTWSASDRGMPWAAATIDTNVVMNIDRESTRMRLAGEYEQYGFVVRDCTRQDANYYRETLRMAKAGTEGIVIMMVDYKYRSSLTMPGFPVGIDSCEVAVPQVVDGVPRVFYRAAYDPEVQQFLGRFGRVAACPTVVYRNDSAPINRMCDREGLECDAANLIYRMWGYRPPIELAEYAYYKGDVPADIALAMISDQPLRLYPESSRVPWVNGHRALEEEKKKAAYQYTVERRLPKPASCHTVLDSARPVTPPPSVPGRYRRETVDVDGLSVYSDTRSSSPVSRLEMDVDFCDNLSVMERINSRIPKRNAKQVREAREKRERDEQRALAEARLSGDVSPVVTADELVVAKLDDGANVEVGSADDSSSVGSVPQVPVTSEFRTGAFRRGGGAPVESVFEVLQKDIDRPQKLESGKYYHYHNMHKAPLTTSTFVKGIDSVMEFGQARNAKHYVRSLTDDDRLFAVSALVDGSNKATAVVVGIQRWMAEAGERSIDDLRDVVDHNALRGELEWMIRTCTMEQTKVQTYQSLVPLFAQYSVDEVSPPISLEHRVMHGLMERIEAVAVKKDPDKSLDYWVKLNSSGMVTSKRVKGRNTRILDAG